jgi:hypothetical protein
VREFSYEAILDDYEVVQSGVRNLDDQSFQFLTSEERDKLRSEVLEEIRTDFAFKLMTLIEADIRADYRLTLNRKRRDEISRSYRELCMQYRRETRQVNKRASVACSRISLDRILDQLRQHFQGIDEDFRRVCSAIKGYFSFRNWYAHGRVTTRPMIPDPEDIFAAYQALQGKVLDR